MYIYIYIYIYVYTCYIYIYIYMYTHICVYNLSQEHAVRHVLNLGLGAGLVLESDGVTD